MQIFISLMKAFNHTEIRCNGLRFPLNTTPELFAAWKERGVIAPTDSRFCESARLDAESFDDFVSGCTEWEKTILRRADIQAQIDATEETLTTLRRQRRGTQDVEQKLAQLRAEFVTL